MNKEPDHHWAKTPNCCQCSERAEQRNGSETERRRDRICGEDQCTNERVNVVFYKRKDAKMQSTKFRSKLKGKGIWLAEDLTLAHSRLAFLAKTDGEQGTQPLYLDLRQIHGS